MDLKAEGDNDVAASVLKRYLANMPEPLMTFELYTRFLQTQSESDPPSPFIRTHHTFASCVLYAHVMSLRRAYNLWWTHPLHTVLDDEDQRAHAISIVLSLLPPINKLLLQVGKTPRPLPMRSVCVRWFISKHAFCVACLAIAHHVSLIVAAAACGCGVDMMCCSIC